MKNKNGKGNKMTGGQLYNFLSQRLVPNQVIHISNVNGYHTFDSVRTNGALRFHVPNNKNPGNPNSKYISRNDIINARSAYNLNRNVNVDRQWIFKNIGKNWNDCRVALLRNLLRMPEFLR